MKRQDDHNMVGSKKQSIENRVDLNVFHPRYKVVHCNYHEKEGARVQNIVTIIIMCYRGPPSCVPCQALQDNSERDNQCNARGLMFS